MTIENLKRIYEPKGKAREYAALALNLYTGCSHKCVYCYNRQKDIYKIEDIFGKDYEDGMTPIEVASKILQEVMHDADLLAEIYKTEDGNNCPEILLSFMGDVYQPTERSLGLTRKVIQVLISRNLPFTILTKAGMDATRDFDILADYEKFRFGTSLVFWKDSDLTSWEFGSSRLISRISAIDEAYNLEIPTWVSMEPVIDPQQALDLVDMLYPIVDSWKVGKINYHEKLEKEVDWIKFRDDIKRKFETYGITDYYLKDSLTKL